MAVFVILLNFFRWTIPNIFTVHQIRRDTNFKHEKKEGLYSHIFPIFAKFLSFTAAEKIVRGTFLKNDLQLQ